MYEMWCIEILTCHLPCRIRESEKKEIIRGNFRINKDFFWNNYELLHLCSQELSLKILGQARPMVEAITFSHFSYHDFDQVFQCRAWGQWIHWNQREFHSYTFEFIYWSLEMGICFNIFNKCCLEPNNLSKVLWQKGTQTMPVFM